MTGSCPLCETPGEVATPCETPGCRRQGLHRVPIEHLGRGALDPIIGRRLGKYLVVERIGAGGMGAVYLALQQPIGLKAALKLLPAEAVRRGAERFRLEAEALARLSHPNIVRLLDYDVQGEQPYLVMELVTDGRTLGEALREGLPVEVALDVLRQVSHALDAAHGIGVIHRDLKPGNVMLQAVQGNPWHVKLVDFGLAKRVDLQESTEFAAGTPVYMAPEQFDRKRLGPWTDWYAVGAMAFEMLAGRRPFEAPTAQELLGQKVRPDYDPTTRAPELPPETRAFLRRVLASDHRRRPQSGEAFRAELEAAFAPLIEAPTVLDAHRPPPADRRQARGLLAIALALTAAAAVATALGVGRGVSVAPADAAMLDAAVVAIAALDAAAAPPVAAPDAAPVVDALPAASTGATTVDAAPAERASAPIKPPAHRRAGPRIEVGSSGRKIGVEDW